MKAEEDRTGMERELTSTKAKYDLITPLGHRGLFLKLLRAKALFPKLFRGPPTPGEGCLSALPKCDHKRTNQRGAAYSSDLSSMYRTAAMGANASTEAILEIVRRVRRVETRFEQKFTSRWG